MPGNDMGLSISCLFITLCIGVVSGTVIPRRGVNYTMQELYNAMSQVMIKNVQLELTLTNVQKENVALKGSLTKCETDRLENENHLIVTKNDHANCSTIKTRLECENIRLDTNLDRCLKVKSSLEDDLVVNIHVLNVSHRAKESCLIELRQCKAVLSDFVPNCKAWFDAGYTKNGIYIIDPDGPGGVPDFEVECIMGNYNGEPVTIVHHDTEKRAFAGESEVAYSNVVNITYKASMDQIIGLLNVSANCEQYIKYECYHSLFSPYSAWYSRDGKPMDYWGGAKPGSGKCACGMTNSCDTPGKVCNCDSNDSQWRADAGLLTDKTTLPVSKMAFGDLGDSYEIGFYRLGALRCYG